MFLAEEEKIPGLLVMIDFEKAFDSISWKYMDKVLKLFNFGPFFRHMLQTLYQNASLCVIQHGFFSEFFKIERGCRQGDPVSPYLFILCVEILGALIRSDNNIKGLNIGQNSYKLLQYADDTALTLDGSELSLRTTLNLLDQFAKFSGLKPNINKTKVVWIGSKINSTDVLCSDRELNWSNESFTFLGVVFSTDVKSIPEMNYINKFEEIKNTIRSWSKRLITPLGKITVVKTLLMSKLTQLFISLPKPSEKEIKELEKCLFKFIWNNKNDRVARKQLIQPYKNGGLKMIHTESFIKTMKLSWIRRILVSESSWMKLFDYIIEEDSKYIFMFGDNYIQKLISKTCNPFWKEVLKNLYEFKSKMRIKDQDLIYQPIWYNSNIKIGNDSIFYKSWFKKGICNVHHMFTKDGLFMSYQQFTDRYQFYPPYTLFYGLKQAILTRWPYLQNMVLYDLPNYPTFIRFLMIYKSNSISVYNVFMDKIQTHNYVLRWSNELDLDMSDFWWEMVNLNIQKCSIDVRLKWFQYRIVHRILGTNKFLHKANIKNSPLCSLCLEYPETIYHLFWQCEISRLFWENLETLLIEKAGKNISFSYKDIIFGRIFKSVDTPVLNIIILLSKFHIYKQKMKNLKPSITALKYEILSYYKSEEYIYIRNFKYGLFQKRWKDFQKVFDDIT